MKKLKFGLALALLLGGFAAVGAVAANNEVKRVDASSDYTLVKDASVLAAGDKIVIVAAKANVAMSTTQNKNNRGQTAITKSGDNIAINQSVQEFTLVAGKVSGSFAFYTGTGYIYAASSSSNYLKTETNLSNNSSWSISITADGAATVKAQGTNTRNLLKYNSSSSLFSCYASGQNDVALYRISGAAEVTADEFLSAVDAIPETVTLDDIAAIDNARYEYGRISEEEELCASEEVVNALAKVVAAEKACAALVDAEILAIGEYNASKEELIDSARAHYNALTDEMKEYVEELDTLVSLETALAASFIKVDFPMVSGDAYDHSAKTLMSGKTINGVTLKTAKGGSSSDLTTNEPSRFYAKSTLTISLDTTIGKRITKIAVTNDVSYDFAANATFESSVGAIASSSGSVSNVSFSANVTSVKVTFAAQVRATNVAVYYQALPQEANSYEITFDANGGLVNGLSTYVLEAYEDNTVTLPTATRSGFKFLGWFDAKEGGTQVKELVATEDITLYAHWKEIVEPAIIDATVAELLALPASNEQLYRVTGVVDNIVNTQYGNFDLVDGESKIYVYGATETETSMKFDNNTGLYTFTNPQDFADAGVEEGDTIEMVVVRVDYGSTLEIKGIITNIEKPEPTLEEKLAGFTTNASVGFSYTKSGEDYTFSKVRLSFRGTISAELYDEVVAAGVSAAGIEVSIEGQKPYTIDCSANIGTDAEGNKYVFGSLLVPEGKENIVVTGKAFVTVDGARLYLASTAHSLVSAVSAYLGDNAPALTAEQLEAVTALAASLGIAA